MDKELREKLVVSKRPTNVSMGETVKKVVEALEWLKEDLAILDYWLVKDYHPMMLSENPKKNCFMDVQAIVNTGGSEGIYVDVAVRQRIYEDGSLNYISLGTLKTLEDSLEAYASMGRLAGVITAVAEKYWLINGDVIEEQNDDLF